MPTSPPLSPLAPTTLPAGRQRRPGRTRGWLCSLAAAALLSACGGGGGDDGSNGSVTTASPAIPVLSMGSATATVVLPSGLAIGTDKLTVRTSVGEATPNASGTVTLTSYVDGEQLAIVLSPAGNPMLMGWIDATHTTISAATTAQVLAYFALNGSLMLNDAERQALMADLPTAPGIDALTATIQSELVRSVDAFAQADPALTQALATFANATYGGAQMSAASTRAHALGIVITPATQSGIDVLQDPPFAAHLTNSFRRRAWAFVDRISHTTGGTDVADPMAVTSFEMPPVIGVNGGVTGALTDIMNAYYGNQATAYAVVSGPSVSIPLVDGSDKTSYQVTVVGAGGSAGVASSLTAAQSTALREVAMRGFLKDFMVPTLANAILGSGAIDFTAGTGDKAKFMADVLTNLTGDFINYATSVPGVNDKIANGQWFDAGVDLTGTAAGAGTVRTILVEAFDRAVKARVAAGLDPGAMKGFMNSFNVILNAAGGVLQAFDSSAYVKDLAQADQADQWTVVVTPQKIALNPQASNVGVGGTVVLTASVLGAEDTDGYSYHWTTTTQFGDLSEVAGGSRIHQSDYCSSSEKAVFTYEKAAAAGTTDTVKVQIYSGPNCDPAKGQLLGGAASTMTFGVTTVNIALRQQWTDTGLAVVPGQQLTITTTGTMNYWTGGCPSTQNCVVTPDGLPWSVCAGSTAGPYLTPGLACFSLVGRFGANGVPFEVGSNLTVTVPGAASGEFFLGVNDNNYPDNTGSWVSTIK
jgi:hypothetical protein